ncbi:MAG: acetyl ornithine aminotransferase family protein [candidate division Zixibacteria bacterium]|nr:acetyl ornithine aminotransferase family protein [candidate division Zixibacteria bacterium]
MVSYRCPKIKTRLPGPKSRRLIDRDERYVSQSYTRAYPVVLSHAQGAYLWDVDGNCFIDFHTGIGVCSTGNCHPQVVEAIKKQAEKAIHIPSADFYHEPVGKLAQKLSEIVPGEYPKRTFFSNSGTEAIETSFKLARYNRKRPRTIAFINGFHGRTMGALSLTCSKMNQRKYFAPLVPEVTHVPYGYCYRCAFNLTYPKCDIACVKFIEEEILDKVAPADEVAAIVVEPIQGEGGYIVPPPGYLPRLKALAEKYGILLITDEIQSGMGKTGRMFAMEHWNVTADIVVIAKALASGMPLGACVASRKLMSWEPGSHSTTFGGNPIACAAGLVTIELLENGLMRNATKMGNYIMKHLKQMMKRYAIMGDVRGKGLMIGIEFVQNRKTKEPAPEMTEQIAQECFRNGLMLLTCGKNVIRFIPPLIISQHTADQALDVFEKAVKKFNSKKRR